MISSIAPIVAIQTSINNSVSRGDYRSPRPMTSHSNVESDVYGDNDLFEDEPLYNSDGYRENKYETNVPEEITKMFWSFSANLHCLLDKHRDMWKYAGIHCVSQSCPFGDDWIVKMTDDEYECATLTFVKYKKTMFGLCKKIDFHFTVTSWCYRLDCNVDEIEKAKELGLFTLIKRYNSSIK